MSANGQQTAERATCATHGKARSLDHLEAFQDTSGQTLHTCIPGSECRLPRESEHGQSSPAQQQAHHMRQHQRNQMRGQGNAGQVMNFPPMPSGTPCLLLPMDGPNGNQVYFTQPLSYNMALETQLQLLFTKAQEGGATQGLVQRSECSTHKKARSMASLEFDSVTQSYNCKAGDECKMPKA